MGCMAWENKYILNTTITYSGLACDAELVAGTGSVLRLGKDTYVITSRPYPESDNGELLDFDLADVIWVSPRRSASNPGAEAILDNAWTAVETRRSRATSHSRASHLTQAPALCRAKHLYNGVCMRFAIH